MIPIHRSILWKLTLAFLLVALTSAALVALFIRITSVDRLTKLIYDQQRNSLRTALTDYYEQAGSWDHVAEDWRFLRARAAAPMVTQGDQETNPFTYRLLVTRDPRRLFGLADRTGTVVIPIDPDYPLGSSLPQKVLAAGTPIMVNGKQVGTLLMANRLLDFNPEENLFLQRTNEALLLGACGALLVALLIGIFLARTLTRPLQALTQAAQRIERGDLEQQVKVASKDEIGELATAFNRMSQEVARVNQMRRDMTADIAHDLRTPLTVIAGYVESMQEGILQPTPERLSLIYNEIEQLQNLVHDLQMLSQVDAGELSLNPQPIDLKILLERAAAPFAHRAEKQGVNLAVELDDHLPELRVDEARMMQVFGNLLINALRYTPEGGKIALSAHRQNGKVVLSVQDTGTGIAPEELPYIFDRFHRADKSRHAEQGETGLGLAIVKALVEAQGGTVRAESTVGTGTTIFLSFA